MICLFPMTMGSVPPEEPDFTPNLKVEWVDAPENLYNIRQVSGGVIHNDFYMSPQRIAYSASSNGAVTPIVNPYPEVVEDYQDGLALRYHEYIADTTPIPYSILNPSGVNIAWVCIDMPMVFDIEADFIQYGELRDFGMDGVNSSWSFVNGYPVLTERVCELGVAPKIVRAAEIGGRLIGYGYRIGLSNMFGNLQQILRSPQVWLSADPSDPRKAIYGVALEGSSGVSWAWELSHLPTTLLSRAWIGFSKDGWAYIVQQIISGASQDCPNGFCPPPPMLLAERYAHGYVDFRFRMTGQGMLPSYNYPGNNSCKWGPGTFNTVSTPSRNDSNNPVWNLADTDFQTAWRNFGQPKTLPTRPKLWYGENTPQLTPEAVREVNKISPFDIRIGTHITAQGTPYLIPMEEPIAPCSIECT